MTLRPHCPQRCLAPSTASTAAWSRAWLTHSAPGCLPWLTWLGLGWARWVLGGRGEQWGVRANESERIGRCKWGGEVG